MTRSNYPLAFVLALFVPLSLIERGAVFADDEPSAKPTVSFATVYLAETIGNAHRILISGELGGEGKVTLEGNTCTITQFGDSGICTKRLFPPIDVEIVQLRLVDPSGQGRRLFQIKGELPEGYKYYLVVPRRKSSAHRLVVDEGKDRRRVVTLEASSAQERPKPKPELAKDGKYKAEQANGVVTIFAEGKTPTPGYKVRLEQLPIRIFPPQYRLVWVPPAGPVPQVLTPFSAKTSFKAEMPVAQVIVHDERGRHKVPVDVKK